MSNSGELLLKEKKIKSKKLEPILIIKWILSLLVPALILLIPINQIFTGEMKIFFVITLWAILMFAFELVDTSVVALALPFLYTLTGISSVELALSPWTQTVPWVTLGGFLLANILERTGLLQRIAFWFILKTNGTYKQIIYALMLACIFINLLQPGSGTVAVAALTYGICIALGLGKSKAAAGIMLTGAIGCLTSGFFIYTPGNLGVLFDVSSSIMPLSISFLDYFKQNIVFIPLMFLLAFMVSRVMKPEEEIQGKDHFRQEQAKLGPMSKSEKKVSIMVSLLLVFLFTKSIHNLDELYGFIIIPLLLYLPGMGVAKIEDFRKIDFTFLIFITGCMSIGAVASSLGVGSLISSLVLPYLESVSSYGLVFAVWLLGVLVNFILTPLAAMATMGAPLIDIANKLGITPYPVMYAFFQGLDQLIFPYEYALYLIFFSFGLIKLKDFMKVFAWKMLICGVYLVLIGLPYWKLIGLLN